MLQQGVFSADGDQIQIGAHKIFVICSIIMFGSICWGGTISKLDRGRLEKIVKKKQVMLWESHWTVLRLYMKRDCTEN